VGLFWEISATQNNYAATLNELHVTTQRWYQTAIPSSHPPNLAALGVQVQSDDPFGPATLSFAGGMTVGFDPNVHWKADNNYAISDTLSWNHGRHTLKFWWSLRDHAGEHGLTHIRQTESSFSPGPSESAQETT